MSLFRNLLIANSKKTVQPDAWILDYIESTGTQYVDLGVTVDSFNETWEYSFSRETTSGSVPVGTETASSTNCFPPALYSTSNSVFVGTSGSKGTLGSNTSTQMVAKTVLSDDMTYEVYRDGELKLSGSFTGTLSDLSVYAFASNQSNAVYYRGAFKISYIKRTVEGVLSNHWYAVEDLDGELGMWDIVNGTCKYNIGSGDFIAGTRVGYIKNGQPFNMDGTPYNPDAYILDSITSTGAQYIDTETTGLKYELDMLSANEGTIKIPCGFATNGAQYLGTMSGVWTLGGGNNLTTSCATRSLVEIDFTTANQATLTVGNDTVTRTGTTAAGSFGLFNYTGTGISGYETPATMWRAKAYDTDGTLVFDYLPCEELDGTVCMWDELSNTYKYNTSIRTDEFTGGTRVGYIRDGIAYNMNGTPYEVDAWILDSVTPDQANSSYKCFAKTPVAWSSLSEVVMDVDVVATNSNMLLANHTSAGIGTGSVYIALNANTVKLSALTGTATPTTPILGRNTIHITNISSTNGLTIDIGAWHDTTWSLDNTWHSVKMIGSDSTEYNYLPVEKADGFIGFWDINSNTYLENYETAVWEAGTRVGYIRDGIAYYY